MTAYTGVQYLPDAKLLLQGQVVFDQLRLLWFLVLFACKVKPPPSSVSGTKFTHKTQESKVCISLETKCSVTLLSLFFHFPQPNRVVFVPKPNQSNVDCVCQGKTLKMWALVLYSGMLNRRLGALGAQQKELFWPRMRTCLFMGEMPDHSLLESTGEQPVESDLVSNRELIAAAGAVTQKHLSSIASVPRAYRGKMMRRKMNRR